MATIALTSSQQQFVRELRKQTGLNSRVLSAWVLAEMGGRNSSAAQKRERARNYNWLNIAYFDSGPGGITKDKVWSDPTKAAQATAAFLKGTKYGASSGIRKILSTAGGSQQDQIRAIAGSGWASSGYNGGQNLRSLLGQAPAPGSASGAPAAGGGGVPAQQSRLQAPDPGAVAAAVASQQAAAAAIQDASKPRGLSQAIPGSAIPLPSFAQKAEVGQAPLQVAQSVGGGPTQQDKVSAALAAISQIQDVPQGELVKEQQVANGPQAAVTATGEVKVAPGAERSGVGLQKPILGLLKQVAGASGRPVVVTTGTNHNKMTTSGNVSDHWGGNAADLGVGADARADKAAGRKGDLLAAHAIQVAAGISFNKALVIAKQGGIHNFNTKRGRVQIIWRTLQGGNHFNHVHVGLNPGR